MPRLLCLLALLVLGPAFANPSSFPETAVFGGVGLSGGVAARLGGEVLLGTPYVDTALGAALYGAPLFGPGGGRLGARLYASALVFPAIGTTPPLALGLGADLGVGTGRGVNFHVGPVVGSDLLFVMRQPVTLSLYLAPGFAAESGFSLAWSFQARYYLDELALELESSDLLPLSLGVRYVF